LNVQKRENFADLLGELRFKLSPRQYFGYLSPMDFQDWWSVFQFQKRRFGPVRGLLRALKSNHLRRSSRHLISRYAPQGFGLELGSGEQTIAPLRRTLLTDAFPSHAGSPSLAREYFSADRIPYPEAHFDFVLNEHVLEHLPNPVAALREWKRVLKPHGKLFLFLPHPERTFDRERAVTSVEHLYSDLEQSAESLSPSEEAHWKDWCENVISRGLASHYASSTREESLSQNLIHRHVFLPRTIEELLRAEGWKVLEAIPYVPDRGDSFAVIAEKQ
jgi:SAM-dependent methyltransferase